MPAAAEQSKNRRPNFGPLIALAAMLACAGCWEEIHYEPKAETADVTSTADEPPSAEEPMPPAADVAATKTDAAANLPQVESPPTSPPTSDELFAPQLPPAADDTAPATDDSEASFDSAVSILPTPPESPTTSTPKNGEEPSSTEQAAPTPPTPAERRLAWQAVSKWTLAAAIYAKGLARSPHAPILDEATAAASELGLELPQLPTAGQPEDLQAAVIEGLGGELAVAIRNTFATRFGEEAGAAADLAVRSHLLLLTYSPRDADASMRAEGLRRAGEASGLPAELWTPLVTLVEQRAPFLDVRQAVFDLHRGADAHLAETARIAD